MSDYKVKALNAKNAITRSHVRDDNLRGSYVVVGVQNGKPQEIAVFKYFHKPGRMRSHGVLWCNAPEIECCGSECENYGDQGDLLYLAALNAGFVIKTDSCGPEVFKILNAIGDYWCSITGCSEYKVFSVGC